MKKLTIFINDQVAYEYDREKFLEERQLEFLDRMDSDMERGVKVMGEFIANPDGKQRAKFVVMNLIRALQQDNETIVSVSCAYLVNRFPALVEIQVSDQEKSIDIDLVEEH